MKYRSFKSDKFYNFYLQKKFGKMQKSPCITDNRIQQIMYAKVGEKRKKSNFLRL